MNWSEIPKQTHFVEDGKIGDCWRCCIAAVLGLPAEEVPHFLADENGELNHGSDADTQAWLNDRGYWLAYATCDGGSRMAFRFPRWARDHKKRPLPPLICCGPTERSKGLGKHHAVVMVGDQLVYDPHPSEAGLTAIVEQWVIFRAAEQEAAKAAER